MTNDKSLNKSKKEARPASGAWYLVASAGVRGWWVGSVNCHVGTIDRWSFFKNHVQKWQSGEILQRIATALKPKMETGRVQLLNAFSVSIFRKCYPQLPAFVEHPQRRTQIGTPKCIHSARMMSTWLVRRETRPFHWWQFPLILSWLPHWFDKAQDRRALHFGTSTS